jgi:hypothetical protein
MTNTEDITVSHTDMPPRVATMTMVKSISPSLFETAEDGNIYDIKSFLSRPQILSQGDFTSTSSSGDLIFGMNGLFRYILTNISTYSKKIYGHYIMRATTVFRLQVNNSPFQAGRLMMVYWPQTTTQDPTKHLTRLTQCPRIEYDLATDSEVHFKVPFISPYLGYDLTLDDIETDAGRFQLIVYSPLNTGPAGETSAEYTLWVHFEDVQLRTAALSTNSVIPQMGGRRKRTAAYSVTEQEIEHDGPISSVLSAVSKASTHLAGVPILSSIAGPVSWAAGIAANVASAFGFSKPTIEGPITMTTKRIHPFASNSDGQDNGQLLSLSATNKLEMAPGFGGSDIDELSIVKFVTRPCYYTTIDWADSAASLDILGSYSLNPSSYFNTATVGASSLRYSSPMAYLSNFFYYYRGSIGFRFKFVKTEYHSGRVAVVFVPGNGPVITSFSTVALTYLHKDIIDLRSSNEITVTFPFVSKTPYLPVGKAYGRAYLVVINDLRHPETASSNVKIIVEPFGCDDFEFAVPETPSYAPVTHQMAIATEGQADNSSTEEVANAPVGTSVHNLVGDVTASKYCIGEKILSIRQLLKRAAISMRVTSAAGSSFRWTDFSPYLAHSHLVTAAVNTPASTGNFDYVDYFAPCFSLFRGGMRIKVLVDGTTSTSSLRVSYLPRPFLGTIQPAAYGQLDASTSVVLKPLLPGVQCSAGEDLNPEINLPFYNNCQSSGQMITNGNSAYSLKEHNPFGTVRITYFGANNAFIKRSVSDDFDFAAFVGVPPLIALNATDYPGFVSC